MKNIYVLPTDKSSRLYLHSDNELQLRTNIIRTSEDYLGSNQHIYITSDKEINDGDWVIKISSLYKGGGSIQKFSFIDRQFKDITFKKVILTTDQDLIQDNVQAIDDEFLEWFVKNPSCEWVEVEKGYLGMGGFCKSNEIISKDKIHYKIIIPKEEPKQIYYNTVGIENGVNVVKGQFNTLKEALDLANELNRKFPDLYYDWRETLIKEEPKEEDCFCTDKCLGYLTKTCKKIENPKQETLKKYPVIIVRNDDNEEFIHLSNGIYRTKWGILNNGVSAHPLEAFDKTKFTFYYE